MNLEIGYRRAWTEDLYLILAGVDDLRGVVDGTNPRPLATFRILVNPLVAWIWFGGIIMALGGLIAMWPTAPAAEGLEPDPAGRRRERDLVEA
jgi:cytochrome c-type biogenesis protein CcmF